MSADPAVFLGTVNDLGDVELDFPNQARAYCKRKLAGKCVDVIIAEQGVMKTRLMEKGYHAMLGPWVLEGHRIEDLKRFCLLQIFGTFDVTNPITGEVVKEPAQPHTSKLTRADYIALIEGTLEIAAECGVILEAPHEYRERKQREAAKAAKRHQQQEVA